MKTPTILLVVAAALLAGCASTTGHVGVSVPIGGGVSVGVGVNTQGSVSGSANASVGGVSVGVGASTNVKK